MFEFTRIHQATCAIMHMSSLQICRLGSIEYLAHIYIRISFFLCVYIYICVCIYVYVYVYTHTIYIYQDIYTLFLFLCSFHAIHMTFSLRQSKIVESVFNESVKN